MSDERLATIEAKLDRYHTDILHRFHGERGDNGVYGRLQSLEEARRNGERREKMLWGFVTSSISGFTLWLFGRHQ